MHDIRKISTSFFYFNKFLLRADRETSSQPEVAEADEPMGADADDNIPNWTDDRMDMKDFPFTKK
ncbi:hypothetical protein NQ314_013467 [Rhamnusium bicolor]|uniref:Uncharacterized protein n=1 Tax=Rhamnusium bicolor TaxID=1586634 RepID=A0AAV8X673_9CUCU|nr:hypothetical protein NQ314_013467 [Rhamnusium bicolor]